MDHPFAQYQMLRFSASQSLAHCPRLIPSQVLAPFAGKHRDHLHKSLATHVLNVATLTDIQRIRVGLPEWEGGIAMTTAYEVMDSGFVASAGAVARWWSGGAWPEAKVLAQVQASSPALRVAVCNLNAQFEGQVIRTDGGVPVHFPVLDPEVPSKFPTQRVISRALHRIAASDLVKGLIKADPMQASWVLSCGLPGSGAWLHAIPEAGSKRLRISREVARTMLRIRLCAPVIGVGGSDRCICGAWGPAVQYGYHWFSTCAKCSYSTVRHNAVVTTLRQMYKKVGWQVIEGECADWVKRRPDLRPFDLLVRPDSCSQWIGYDVGVADATRMRLVPSGAQHFKKGQAAALYAHKKQGYFNMIQRRYGLKPGKSVEYRPVVFEVSGGFGNKVTTMLAEIEAAAQAKGAGVGSEDWTWSAQDFSSWYLQVISMDINKLTALAVLNGQRAAATAVVAAAAAGVQ